MSSTDNTAARIAARDEYIALLQATESKSLTFLFVHGHHAEDEVIAEGKRLRKLIARLDAEHRGALMADHLYRWQRPV